MSGPFKMKGWSPFTQKEEKKNIPETIHEKLQSIKDPLAGYKAERQKRKSEEGGPGMSYVHKYYIKGTTEDWSGHESGTRGKLKPGYPKYVKLGGEGG